MSDFASPLLESTVAGTLRAAGCVFAEDEARLLVSAARTPDELAAMVERRAGGLPLEHVVGWAEFCGLRIAVDPGVFVPRRGTEFLVRQAVALAAGMPDHAGTGPAGGTGDPAGAGGTGRSTGPVVVPAVAPVVVPVVVPVVLDLCCGSGAIGVAIGAALPRIELHAADLDPAAVRCARRNVLAAGGQVHEGDLFAALPAGLRGRIDLLTANVPYVPTDSVGLLPPEARDHEARIALDGGPDGLDVLRRVGAGAAGWLAPGGVLLFETSERQAPYAVEIVRSGGLQPRVATDEDLHATVVTGTAPGR